MGIEHVDMERGRVKGKEKNRERIYIDLWGGRERRSLLFFFTTPPPPPRPFRFLISSLGTFRSLKTAVWNLPELEHPHLYSLS
jgi:hypothetical protein